MRRTDAFDPGEIRNRASDLQDPGIGTCREPELRHGALDERGAGRVRARAGLKLAGIHLGVAPGGAEAHVLTLASPRDPRRDRDGRFAARRTAELAVSHRGHVDVQVDPIQEGAGEPRVVVRQLIRCAAAAAQRVAFEAARAGIHRGHQHQSSGVGNAPTAARDRHVAIFQRLPEAFEDIAPKLGKLVEEEDPVVRERELSRPRRGAAPTEQPGRRDGVVRRAKRPAGDHRTITEHAGGAVDARDVQRLGERERRQQRGEPPRKHGLACAGRADEQQVVATGGGDLEGAFHGLLSADFREVERALRRDVGSVRRRRLHLGGLGAAQHGHGLAQVPGRDDRDAVDERRFGRVGARDHHVRASGGPCCRRDRQRAPDRPHAAVERELARDGDAAQVVVEGMAGRREHGERDRQIVRGAFLSEVRRREVHGDAAGRNLEAGIAECRPDTVLALADARVRQADGLRVGNAGREVDLDLDGMRVDADERARDDGREHGRERPRRSRHTQRCE